MDRDGVLCVCNRLNKIRCEPKRWEVTEMGFRIKEVRKSLKMSQEELAEKSGVSRGTIVALEAGTERVTTTKTLVALAAAMNVSIDQIFFADDV